MATSKNATAISTNMATYSDMSSNSLSIVINFSDVQDPWSDLDPEVNGCCLSYNFSVYYNDDNSMPPIFYRDDFPYEDRIPGVDIIYERSF